MGRDPGQLKEYMMAALLREVIGEVLRRARTSQGRTLRQVSDSARVSLGYLSEVERGRKEASSELLTAICGALEVPLSDVLTDAGRRLASEERREQVPYGAMSRSREVGAPPACGGQTAANIDAATKVVIPSVVSMAVA
jgi:transcriptional regulator with XRE-family HTH domain